MPQRFSRRTFLVATGGAASFVVVGACGGPDEIDRSSAEVQAAEERRRRPGATVRDVSLTAGLVDIELAGRRVSTWAYNGSVPGPEVRLSKGEVLRARIDNQLPEPTSIHWHGLAIRNDMDGVPGLTQQEITPGTSFTYEFTVPDSGTYWFHPHSGMQLDRGLYTPLIIDDPDDPGDYDRELVVVLDDWTDGVGEAPDAIFDRLTTEGMDMGGGGGGMGGMDMGGMDMGGMTSDLLGGDAGDVRYPLYLINGRPPEDPATFEVGLGERLRLRLINAGADTAFRVAMAGHSLTVTHTDGFPVEPVPTDAIMIGMAERYDALVTVDGAGVFPLVAEAEGKQGQARALVRSAPGDAPPAVARPSELDGRILTVADLRAAPEVALAPAEPDAIYEVVLNGGMDQYDWRINGRPFAETVPLEVNPAQRVRLVFDNRTMMFHPMHLHGHTFEVRGPAGPGPRKDTVIVRPMERIEIDFVTDNPGQWLLHCHNLYHQEVGMATVLSYVS